MRAVIAVVATFLGVVAYLGPAAVPAAACSCVAPRTEQWLREGRAAILGKPVLVLSSDALYEVEQSFNVKVTRQVTVYGGGGSCGLWPTIDEGTYGIFFEAPAAGEAAVDELGADQCSRVTKEELLDGAKRAGASGNRPVGVSLFQLPGDLGWRWIAAGVAGALTAGIATFLVGYRLGVRARRPH